MKIDSSYQPVATALPPRTAPAPAASNNPQEAVSLSPLAGTLQTGDSKPPVNNARIQEIKQAIAEGKFKVNPEAIADRLIETARDLLNTSRREA